MRLSGWYGRGNGGNVGERRRTCSFFLEKKKEPKKNRLPSACLPDWSTMLGTGVRLSLYERRRTYTDLRCLLTMSQRLLLGTIIRGSREAVIWSGSGYRESGLLF